MTHKSSTKALLLIVACSCLLTGSQALPEGLRKIVNRFRNGGTGAPAPTPGPGLPTPGAGGATQEEAAPATLAGIQSTLGHLDGKKYQLAALLALKKIPDDKCDQCVNDLNKDEGRLDDSEAALTEVAQQDCTGLKPPAGIDITNPAEAFKNLINVVRGSLSASSQKNKILALAETEAKLECAQSLGAIGSKFCCNTGSVFARLDSYAQRLEGRKVRALTKLRALAEQAKGNGETITKPLKHYALALLKLQKDTGIFLKGGNPLPPPPTNGFPTPGAAGPQGPLGGLKNAFKKHTQGAGAAQGAKAPQGIPQPPKLEELTEEQLGQVASLSLDKCNAFLYKTHALNICNACSTKAWFIRDKPLLQYDAAKQFCQGYLTQCGPIAQFLAVDKAFKKLAGRLVEDLQAIPDIEKRSAVLTQKRLQYLQNLTNQQADPANPKNFATTFCEKVTFNFANDIDIDNLDKEFAGAIEEFIAGAGALTAAAGAAGIPPGV